MDDFQFIIESPDIHSNSRKRPRLVTSCDNWYVALLLGKLLPDTSAVALRRSNVFKLHQMLNAKHAAWRRFRAGFGTEKGTS